jgi:hypothetical protein
MRKLGFEPADYAGLRPQPAAHAADSPEAGGEASGRLPGEDAETTP